MLRCCFYYWPTPSSKKLFEVDSCIANILFKDHFGSWMVFFLFAEFMKKAFKPLPIFASAKTFAWTGLNKQLTLWVPTSWATKVSRALAMRSSFFISPWPSCRTNAWRGRAWRFGGDRSGLVKRCRERLFGGLVDDRIFGWLLGVFFLLFQQSHSI